MKEGLNVAHYQQLVSVDGLQLLISIETHVLDGSESIFLDAVVVFQSEMRFLLLLVKEDTL